MFAGWEQALVVLGGVALQLCLALLVLVRRPQRQSSALAWILLILLLPAAVPAKDVGHLFPDHEAHGSVPW